MTTRLELVGDFGMSRAPTGWRRPMRTQIVRVHVALLEKIDLRP